MTDDFYVFTESGESKVYDYLDLIGDIHDLFLGSGIEVSELPTADDILDTINSRADELDDDITCVFTWLAVPDPVMLGIVGDICPNEFPLDLTVGEDLERGTYYEMDAICSSTDPRYSANMCSGYDTIEPVQAKVNFRNGRGVPTPCEIVFNTRWGRELPPIECKSINEALNLAEDYGMPYRIFVGGECIKRGWRT